MALAAGAWMVCCLMCTKCPLTLLTLAVAKLAAACGLQSTQQILTNAIMGLSLVSEPQLPQP